MKNTKIKIYVASKVRHAAKWLNMRASGLPINSTWIDYTTEEVLPMSGILAIRCIEESRDADAILFYTNKDDDVHKGSLLEVGSALGALRPIVIVGNGEGLGKTFDFHPLVKRNSEIDHAFSQAETQNIEPLISIISKIINNNSK